MKHKTRKTFSRSPPTLRTPALGAGVVIAQILGSASLCWAAAGGEKGTVADLMWPAINLSLYVMGMYFLLRGVIVKGWARRTDRISAEASRGERELAAANAILAAARERYAKLPTEKASLVAALTGEARAEANKVVSDGKDRARQIEKQAANRIVAEQQAALESTRRRIAEKVIATTEAKIRAGFSADADRRIRFNTAVALKNLKGA